MGVVDSRPRQYLKPRRYFGPTVDWQVIDGSVNGRLMVQLIYGPQTHVKQLSPNLSLGYNITYSNNINHFSEVIHHNSTLCWPHDLFKLMNVILYQSIWVYSWIPPRIHTFLFGLNFTFLTESVTIIDWIGDVKLL